jgi:hypothetical protein
MKIYGDFRYDIPQLPSTNWEYIEEEQLDDAAADQGEKDTLGVCLEEGEDDIEEVGNNDSNGDACGKWPTEN